MEKYISLNRVTEHETVSLASHFVQSTSVLNKVQAKNRTNKGNFFRKACFTLLTTGIIFGGSSRIEAQTVIKNDSIKPYVNFLENNKLLTAKEYILSKFETYDIVVLSERLHHDMTQYDVILDVVKDERFKGHIYTEIGHVNLSERFNNFLLNSSFTQEEKERELLNIYRDLAPTFTWGAYNYYHLLSEVWEINKNRKTEDKILIFPTDFPFDYSEMQTHREWTIHLRFIQRGYFHQRYRDQIMGWNFVEFYETVKKEKRQALVIQNSSHGYKQMPTYLPLPTRPFIGITGEFIYKTYPDKTFFIYINSLNFDNLKLSADGIIDAAFEYTQKFNVGFDLKDTPVGNTKFDLFDFGNWFGGEFDTNINYDYIFDGMIFYKPLREMVIKVGVPNLYTKENEDMFLKRVMLTLNKTLEDDKEFIDELLEQLNNFPYEIPLDEWFDVEIWDKQIKKWIE